MTSNMLLFAGLFWGLSAFAQPVHHRLNISVIPSLHQISGEDQISALPGRSFEISLNKALHIEFLNAKILQATTPTGSMLTQYLLQLNAGETELRTQFSGVIFDPVHENSSTGLISTEGMGLFGASGWYPHVEGQQLSFELNASGPTDWKFISQGQLQGGHWQCSSPQEEIFLMGGVFQVYELSAGAKTYSVYLRNDQHQADAQLAQKFLDLTPGYIEHYSKIIAPYPYPQFSVVENFWETGFGMPSFTLLGPSVIRLPFIFTSSYPHEILHNWWGNSVYVDDTQGNWSEGLTTYMGDHWQQELIHQDDQYRLSSLLNYASYVNSGADFPLRDFKGRHNQSSQAVGYGKSMMLFHMLATQFGKKTFEQALQYFYSQNQFRAASFKDIQNSFEKITGLDLTKLFAQWLNQTGAPQIALAEARLTNPKELQFQITQNKDYDLTIPVLVRTKSGEVETRVQLSGPEVSTHLQLNDEVLSVTVDPHYDVFRELYAEEKPAILSQLTGASQILAAFNPNDNEAGLFVKTWQSQIEGQITRINNSGTGPLPADKPILLLGDLNQDVLSEQFLKSTKAYDVTIEKAFVRLAGQSYDLQKSAVMISVRNADNLEQTLTWIHWPAGGNTPIAEWASRLLHYGKFSVLVFTGKPNVYKNTWTSQKSPLRKDF